MTLDELRACCLEQPASEETIPFGPDALVYKVMGKMFALLPAYVKPGEMAYVVFKAEPHLGQLLRESWPAVTDAWHFNKIHWNSVLMDGTVPDDEVRAWIVHSYALVVKGLTRVQRAALAESLADA
jgi:predicted DNA-binding protein (MmcQ/YjbR family)